MLTITYDAAKNEANIRERNLSFEMIREIDWDTAIYRPDFRKDYGEFRLRVLAMLHGRLHVAVITPRGNGVRVISFRKANEKEKDRYEQEKEAGP